MNVPQTYCTKGDCPETKCIRNYQKQYNIFKVQGIADPKWAEECPWNPDNKDEDSDDVSEFKEIRHD